MKLNNVVETNLHVIPKTKNEIPTKPTDVSQLRHVIHLQLADPTFNVRGKIDLLLGAEYSSPILANTSLIAPSSCTEDLISKFWELESVLDKKHLSNEEKGCEIQFDQTTKCRDDGRFVVELPFDKNIENLGPSKSVAMKRFQNVEKTLEQQ